MIHESDMPNPEFLIQHGEFIRRLALGLVGSAGDADDLAQEVSIAALDAPRELRQPRAWLRRVAHNLNATRHRRDTRRRARDLAAAHTGAAPSAADDAARLELQRRLVEEVYRLDEALRAAVIARFFDGLPPREVARKFSIPVETVRTRTRRALAQLRGRLDRSHGGDRRAWLSLAAVLAIGAPSRAGVVAVLTGIAAIALVAVGVVVGRGEEERPVRRTAEHRVASAIVGAGERPTVPDTADPAANSHAAVVFHAKLHGADMGGIVNGRVRVVAWDRSPRSDARWFGLAPPVGFREIAVLPTGEGEIPVPGSGDWIVELSGRDYLTRYMHVQVSSPGGSIVCGMTQGVARSVRVVDEDGSPVVGARLLVGMRSADEWPRAVAVSDARGWIRWDGYAGDSGWIVARENCWRPLASDQTLVIERGHRLEGVVVDETGRRLDGAIVRLEGRTLPRQEVTGVEGHFAFAGVPDRFCTLFVSAEGYVDGEWRRNGTHVKLELRMQRGVSFSGSITLPDGAPASDALVDLRPARSRAEVRRAASDEQGAFSFSGLPAGRWRMTARHGSVELPGRKPIARYDVTRNVNLAAGKDTREFEFQLGVQELSYIPLLVIDERGRPQAGMQVRAGVDTPPTDAFGLALVVLRRTPGSRCTVEARMGKFGARGSIAVATRLEPGGAPERMVARVGRTVTVIARQSDGTPLPKRARVTIYVNSSACSPLTAAYDRATVMCWPYAKGHTLGVQVPGFGAVVKRRWQPPEQAEVEIRMPPARGLVAEFVLPGGAAATRARVEIVGWNGEHRKEQLGLSDYQGRFQGFIPADVELMIHVELGVNRWLGRIPAGPVGETIDLSRVVLRAPRVCSGVVVSASGVPVAGAAVYALSPGGMIHWKWCRTTSDAEGQFRIRVPEGVELRVWATHEGMPSRPVVAANEPLRLTLEASAGIDMSFGPGAESTSIRQTIVRDRKTRARMVATTSNGQSSGWVKHLPQGSYEVEVRGDGWSQTHDVDLKAGENVHLRLESPAR